MLSGWVVYCHHAVQVEVPHLEEEDYDSDDDTPSNSGGIFHCETVIFPLVIDSWYLPAVGIFFQQG